MDMIYCDMDMVKTASTVLNFTVFFKKKTIVVGLHVCPAVGLSAQYTVPT